MDLCLSQRALRLPLDASSYVRVVSTIHSIAQGIVSSHGKMCLAYN